jgi:hypothetical protein
MPPLESYAHLIDVDILAYMEVTLIIIPQMPQ